jgi:hypothetical protein
MNHPTVDEAIEAAARCEGTPMRWARCMVVLAREIIRLRGQLNRSVSV